MLNNTAVAYISRVHDGQSWTSRVCIPWCRNGWCYDLAPIRGNKSWKSSDVVEICVLSGSKDSFSIWICRMIGFIGFFLVEKKGQQINCLPWMGPIKCPQFHDQINTRCCEPRRCYLRDPWEMGGRLVFSKQRGLAWNLPISKQHIRTHAEQHQRTFRSCSSTKGTREYASSEAFIQHIYPLCTIEQ